MGMNEQAASQHYMCTRMCTYAPVQHLCTPQHICIDTCTIPRVHTHTHVSQVHTARAGGVLASLRFGVLACVA